jgi:hypothetical protein
VKAFLASKQSESLPKKCKEKGKGVQKKSRILLDKQWAV